MIRRAITVSIRRLTQKDYDGISSVIRQIPLVHFATPPEERESPDRQVNPPVVTIQSTPPNSSSLARNTLDLSRLSSRRGTSRSHPLVDLTQPVTSRVRASSRRRSSRSRMSPRSSKRSLTRSSKRRHSRQDRDRVPRPREDRDPSRGRDSHDSNSRQTRRK
jgi:hypothetical protein